MNKILQLFDKDFVLNLFRQQVLPLYPEFVDLIRVEIKPYKDLVWKTTYHVVISFETWFLTAQGQEVKILIVCSAHDEEPRENIYLVLKYLWAVGLHHNFIDLPRPLFYSQEFNGTFYQGLRGANLLSYIKDRNFPVVKEIVAEAAKLLSRLHSLPVSDQSKKINFNFENSRIKTVIPGIPKILKEMERRYHGKYNMDLNNIYNYFVQQEEEYFSQGAKLVLIHGDAHPENIIRTAPGRLGLIDFTDLCLGDRARDLGSFIQQLEYSLRSKDPRWSVEMKKLFLNTYLQSSGLELDASLKKRIELYYNWTATRTIVYWFLKFNHDEDKALSLLSEVKDNLKV